MFAPVAPLGWLAYAPVLSARMGRLTMFWLVSTGVSLTTVYVADGSVGVEVGYCVARRLILNPALKIPAGVLPLSRTGLTMDRYPLALSGSGDTNVSNSLPARLTRSCPVANGSREAFTSWAIRWMVRAISARQP